MARLLSVNIGMPKDVPWQGRTVHTGIFKYPVDDPLKVGRLNIDGDGQGDLNGHGGEMRAVLVYQRQSYDFWQQRLGRDDLEYGQFGENLTVDGLPDDEVHIGDRYRIGEAEFEVTQPRVTCFRVGMRLGEPEMPALLVAHHRPGFYLRVITEGHIQVGDEIIRIRVGRHRMSVATIDALLYLPDRNVDQLRKAVDIPALSPGWQGSFGDLLNAAEHGTPTSGIGVTPVLAMLHTLAATGSRRDIWWLHTARSVTEHAFAAEAHQLLDSLDRGHEHVYYSGESSTTGEVLAATPGRLNHEVLAGLGLPTTATAYLCGPGAFIATMRAALMEIGLDADRIHSELFGALPAINPGITDIANIPPSTIRSRRHRAPHHLTRSGLTVPWNDDYATVLEFAEACDVPTRWSCRSGVCHTCQTPLLSGTVRYRPDPLEPPAPGAVLVCCSRPETDLVLDL